MTLSRKEKSYQRVNKTYGDHEICDGTSDEPHYTRDDEFELKLRTKEFESRYIDRYPCSTSCRLLLVQIATLLSRDGAHRLKRWRRI